jgi:hypothetical protein
MSVGEDPIIVHPRSGVYKYRQGRIQQRKFELDDEFNNFRSENSSKETDDCKKGRLTVLFKMALVWNKNKDLLFNEDGQPLRNPCSSSSASPRRENTGN